MSEWDDIEARLEEDIYAAGNATGALAQVYAADIRSALGEIERLRTDLSIAKLFIPKSGDPVPFQARAEAAEAELAEEQAAHARTAECRAIEERQRDRAEMDLILAQAEVERLRGEKAQIVGYIQRWQPAGSPPSTDALGLVRWIMGSVQEKLDAAETLVDSIAPDGVYGDEIAKARAALRGGGE